MTWEGGHQARGGRGGGGGKEEPCSTKGKNDWGGGEHRNKPALS